MKMRGKRFPRVKVVAIATAIFLAMPASALSTSFSKIVTPYQHELAGSSGPGLTIPINLPYIGSFLGFDANEMGHFFGIDEDLIGPGGLFTGFTFYSDTVNGVASASGMLAFTIGDVWDIYEPQLAGDRWTWGSIYQLDGIPGTSANISLDYEYSNSHYNVATLGQSISGSKVELGYAIIPASMIYSIDPKRLANEFTLYTLLGPTLYGFLYPLYDHHGVPPLHELFQFHSLEFSREYEWVDVNFGDKTVNGFFDVGTMKVGDLLYYTGYLNAYTEVEAYSAPSVNIATSVTCFESDFIINDIDPSTPVPEPATVLFLGSGLVGLAGLRRKFRKA